MEIIFCFSRMLEQILIIQATHLKWQKTQIINKIFQEFALFGNPLLLRFM